MKINLTKKNALTAGILIIIAIALLYWVHGLFYLSTDDAYVNANVVQIAARVNGQVLNLSVTNNQHVEASTPLFDLDPESYQATLDEYQGMQTYANAKVQIAKITTDRENILVKKNAAAKQDGDTAFANYQSAIGAEKAAIASVKVAALNLAYTKVVAPTSGWVTNLSLRVGDAVTANQAQFALISDKEFWLDANFEESQLEKIKVGQTADVKVDMYPTHHFKGVVESISGGTGSAFSLLPPENATGNWVKVTQRIPVRIRIVDIDPTHPLRIGASGTVTLRISPWS